VSAAVQQHSIVSVLRMLVVAESVITQLAWLVPPAVRCVDSPACEWPTRMLVKLLFLKPVCDLCCMPLWWCRHCSTVCSSCCSCDGSARSLKWHMVAQWPPINLAPHAAVLCAVTSAAAAWSQSSGPAVWARTAAASSAVSAASRTAHASNAQAATSATQPSTLPARVMLATQWLLCGMRIRIQMMRTEMQLTPTAVLQQQGR
jgi:hypothetical protein